MAVSKTILAASLFRLDGGRETHFLFYFIFGTTILQSPIIIIKNRMALGRNRAGGIPPPEDHPTAPLKDIKKIRNAGADIFAKIGKIKDGVVAVAEISFQP